MKTILLLLSLITACASANATLLLTDTFTYTNGALTNVSAGKWRHTSGSTDDVNVVNGTVELNRSDSEDVDAALATSFPANSSTVLYAKFSIFVLSPSGAANGNYFAHVGGASARARVFAVTNGAAAGKFRLGLANGGTTAAIVWPVDLNTNQSYTVVTRHVISNATATLWVNPASDSDTSITAADVASASSASAYAWRQDTGMGVLTVDNLVVATSFGEALTRNETPTISDIPNQQAAESSGTVTVPFTIGDAETPAAALSLRASASPSGTLVQSFSFSGSESNRFFNLTLNPGQTGTVTCTVFVSDGTTTNSDSFVLTVIPGSIFSDNFSYANGALITNGSPPWAHHSGTTGQIQLVNGKIVLSKDSTEDVNVSLPGGPYATNSGLQLYASFRVNFSQLPGSSGDYVAHFNTTGARCRLFANTANAGTGKFRLGIANGSNSISEQLSVDLSTNTSHLVVMRYNPATGVSTIWANPLAESDAGTNATDAATASAISAFAFREDPGIGVFTVDELRVGLSFAAVAESLPRLRIVSAPNAVRISWPATATGFVLQSNAVINTTNWQNVLTTPVVVGSENVVTNPAASGNAFFRLRK